jgi:radical SAM protein with 4Fe4S-binding SPASM domain
VKTRHPMNATGTTFPALSRMYAHLGEGVTVHHDRRDPFITSENPRLFSYIGHDMVGVLSACDGTRTLGEIMDPFLSLEDDADRAATVEMMVTLSEFIRDGIVHVMEKPEQLRARIRGNGSTYLPTNIQVEITKACNLHCSYCYRKAEATDSSGRLPTADLLTILDRFRDCGIGSVEITGGEPLLHPDFLRIILHCCERFLLVGVLTNGTLLNETIVRHLVPYRDRVIFSVSLDSHLPGIHDTRRGMQGAFAKTTEAVRILARYGFTTRVSMAIDRHNWQHIEPTLLLAQELGASAFGYAPVLPFGRGKEDFAFWDSFVSDFLPLQKALTEKYPRFLNIQSGKNLHELQQPGGCGAGYRVYAMDPGGRIRPCVTFEENMATFGSLQTQDPEAVFSCELSEAFAGITPPDYPVCEGCRFANFCRFCSLRGLTAAQWLDEGQCRWLGQPEVSRWKDLVVHQSRNTPGV